MPCICANKDIIIIICMYKSNCIYVYMYVYVDYVCVCVSNERFYM